MKKTLSLILCLLMLAGTLTACGSSSGAKEAAVINTKSTAAMGAAAEYAVEEESMDVSASLSGSTGESGSTALPENRKWIVTIYMDAETEDLDSAISAIDREISELGGYVEDQSVYNGSTYASRRYRSSSMTIRIPAEQADTFTQKVGGIANVISKEKNLEDITLSYVATESRMTALQTEQTRLLELLAKAETMSDLLEIEARLTDVRYELERVTSQLRLYNNQIDYATIYLSLSEVQEYTPVEEPTLLERIQTGFSGSLKGIGEGFVDILVWLIVCSPYIVVFAALALVIFLIVKRIRKSRAKRKVQKKEQT